MSHDKFNQIITIVDSLSVLEIDEQVESLQRELDLLRLVRQIAVIREESQVAGAVAALPTVPLARTQDGALTGDNKPPEAKSADVSNLHYLPRPGTAAYKAYELLKEKGTLKMGHIIKGTGCERGVLREAIKAWAKKGLFRSPSFGFWELTPSDQIKFEVAPKDEVAKENVTKDEPAQEVLNGNASLVRAYLQRNQPAKPAIIAADLNLSLTEVALILQSYKCFTMNGNGWLLKKKTLVVA